MCSTKHQTKRKFAGYLGSVEQQRLLNNLDRKYIRFNYLPHAFGIFTHNVSLDEAHLLRGDLRTTDSHKLSQNSPLSYLYQNCLITPSITLQLLLNSLKNEFQGCLTPKTIPFVSQNCHLKHYQQLSQDCPSLYLSKNYFQTVVSGLLQTFFQISWPQFSATSSSVLLQSQFSIISIRSTPAAPILSVLLSSQIFLAGRSFIRGQ